MMPRSAAVNARWNGLTLGFIGDSANDVLGVNNGTLVNGATNTGGYFVFDGVNDAFSLPNNCFKPSGKFTIMFSIILNSVGNQFHISFGDGSAVNGIIIYTPAGIGDIRMYNTNAGSPVITITSGYAPLTTGVEYHYTFVHDPTITNKNKVYVNGVLNNSNTTTGDPSFPSTSYSSFGAGKTGSSSYVNTTDGKIRSFYAFDGVALDATTIAGIYNSGTLINYPN